MSINNNNSKQQFQIECLFKQFLMDEILKVWENFGWN